MGNFSKNIALWIIIGLLLIALFNLFQGTSSKRSMTSVSFSDFIAATDSGNVSEVNIRGNYVEGYFDDGRPFSTYAPMYRLAFEEMVRGWQRLQRNPDQTVSGSMLPYISTQFERVMERAFNDQYALIEKRLNVLATISSAAPFIGLFGTVLGIIRSFQNIGTSGVTSLAAVAPGISEALIATAAGLLAAIPALMAYNHFRNSARKQANDMRDFSMELANRIEWIVHGQLTVARE